MNRFLTKRAKYLRLNAELPKSFLAEAVSRAVESRAGESRNSIHHESAYCNHSLVRPGLTGLIVASLEIVNVAIARPRQCHCSEAVLPVKRRQAV